MGQKNVADIKILVVEDERVIGRACTRILSNNGYSVTLARDGDSAQSMLDTEVFDVCLLDVRIPGKNGLEVYNYIKDNIPGLLANVIFMTGDVLSDSVAEFLSENKALYLVKPFTVEELENMVKRVIGIS